MTTSVIIPCHNAEEWIAQTLDSVGKQTHQAPEVFVVADSCTDDSAKIAQSHATKPKVLSCAFGNAAAARNFGVSFATAELVAFLDADDWWISDHLRTASDALSTSGDVAYIANYTEFWQASGAHFEHEPLFAGGLRTGLSSDQFYSAFLNINPGWTTCSMVIRRGRFEEVGGFDTSLQRRHDTELFARVVFGKTWTYNPAPAFYYRKEVPGAISAARAQCAYFRFLADSKIAELYGKDRAVLHLRDRANTCMSETFRSSVDSELFTTAAAKCLPHLDLKRRLFYNLARLAPGAGRGLYSLATGIKRRFRGRRTNSDMGRWVSQSS